MKHYIFILILISVVSLNAQIDDLALFQQLQNNSTSDVNYEIFKNALNLKADFKLNYAYQDSELKHVIITFKKQKHLKNLVNEFKKQYGDTINNLLPNSMWIKNGLKYEFDLGKHSSLKISLAKFNSMGKLDFSDNVYILDYKNQMVYKNSSKQDIYILGTKMFADSPGWNDCYIYIDEGNFVNESLKRLPSPHDNAYNPCIDFIKTEDNHYNIIIKSDTGGSGGIINLLIFSFVDSYPNELLNSEKIEIINFSGKYLNDYKAYVTFTNKDSININLNHRKKMLIENNIYSDAVLKDDIILWGNALVNYKILNDNVGDSKIILYQEIRGFANIDRIALIESTLAFRENQWVLLDRKITPY